MVKKLKYLLFFIPFLFIDNVYALNLGSPQTFTYFTDGSEISGNATSIGYWGSDNYWKSPTKLGSFTSASPNANSVQFFWNSANLCENKDISISGTIAVLSDFFIEQTYNARVVMNGENLSCSFTQENASRIRYTCYGYGGGHFQIFFEQTSFYGSYRNYDIAVSKSVDLSCDVSNQAIVNQSIQNTQDIINNQNQNTQDITSNQNQNTQDIINNQNSNTESTNKTIEDQFQNCRDSLNLFDKSNPNIINVHLNNSTTISNSPSNRSLYIPIDSNTTYTVSRGVTGNPFVIGTTEEVPAANISYFDRKLGQNSRSLTLTSSSNSHYLVVWFWNNTNSPFTQEDILNSLQIQKGSTATSYEPYGVPVCSNRLDEQTDAINGLNDSITSESTPNTNQDISDMNDMIASDTPISDLITMPLTLINAYINGIGSSCSSVNLGTLLGTNLIIPCINIQQHIGSDLWNTIDTLCCIFLCYEIAMLFISAFDGITSLRDDFESLYQPKHAYTGYVPKHGGGN